MSCSAIYVSVPMTVTGAFEVPNFTFDSPK